MPDMTSTDPARHDKGTSDGGKFAPEPNTESDVVLNPAPTGPVRTAFGGYELRGFRTAGRGMEGHIWSASIYKDGKKTMAVTDQGDGGELRFADNSGRNIHASDTVAEFTAVADKLHPEFANSYGASAEMLCETLVFSAELDKFQRKYSVDRATAVDDHIREGVLDEKDCELFADPQAILDRD